jgi:hypothetical protein
MKLCVCGIGGAGGKVTRNFLENADLDSGILSWFTDGKYVSPGGSKGIWLEADKDDAKNKQGFFKDLDEGGYPGFFIPHDSIPDGSELHRAVRHKYGYNVKKQGYVRDAQYLKAIFEIFDSDEEIQKIAANMVKGNEGVSPEPENLLISNNNDSIKKAPNPIFDCAWDAIKPYTILGDGDCDTILFIVSLGGGTGTGFINPIVDHIRAGGKTDFPVFVLGIFTDPGDRIEGGQFSREGQRYLSAASALYDLLTKRNGANGVILIDNQILEKRAGSDRKSQNEFIYKVMKPMVVGLDYPGENPVGQAMEKEFSRGLSWPPIFVPYYWSQPRRDGSEEELVRRALNEGMLFDSTSGKADKAFVFCRGFIDKQKIMREISKLTGLEPEVEIQVFRKMGEENDEILILLRNPYGDDPGAYKRDGTLENKLCKVTESTLQYMNTNAEDLFYEGKESRKQAKEEEDEAVKLTKEAKQSLEKYFFGEEGYIKDDIGKTNGLAFELKEANRRLKAGEKPFFLDPLWIFKKDARKKIGDVRKTDVINLDENRIVEIVDRRIDEKLDALKSLIRDD